MKFKQYQIIWDILRDYDIHETLFSYCAIDSPWVRGQALIMIYLHCQGLRCYIVPFHHSHPPRKDGSIAVLSPENDYIVDLPSTESQLYSGFPPFYARLPPSETYNIVDFPPVLYSSHVYGGPFVVIV